MALRRTLTRLALVATVVATLLASAAPALAATGEPTLGLSALQQRLDDSPTGTLTGYMKTVLRGSTIETIPIEILAVTGDEPSTPRILFEASGPKIAAIGGVAAGMSGSPLYVEDGGVWKVVGALSSGDYFTLGGMALATPIEQMLAIGSDYSPGVQRLSKPVLASGRIIDRVIVSDHPEKLSAASATGAFVARPLATVFIGGLRPGTGAYEHLAAALSANGVAVRRTVAPLAGTSSFATELVPGAAVAASITRGDMWIGGIGTVTYEDDGTVLAYGHPAFWTGATSMYMANAWISGIWPSQYDPYKIGAPGAVKGVFTQDRYAGILGVVGDAPAEVPITAAVTNTDTGRTGGTTVYMSSGILDAGLQVLTPGAAAAAAGYKVFDSDAIPGSAVTTTTVVVSSGGHEYTVVMTNVFDDPSDIVYAMTEDVDIAVSRLLSVLDYGLESPHIVSVDLEASATSGRRNARIVGVNTLAPLSYGENAVRVSLLAYGMAATQTVDMTVYVPNDVPLTGELTAACVNSSDSAGGGEGSFARESVSEIVDGLGAMPNYGDVSVAFVPASDPDASPSDASAASPGATSVTTPWYLTGSATTQVTEISADPITITYGQDAYVTGVVVGPVSPVEVRVYLQYADGRDEVLLASGMTDSVDGAQAFEIPVSGLAGPTALRIAVDGGPGYTPAEDFIGVTVRGRVRVAATPKSTWRGSWVLLTATVAPDSAAGWVRFQYFDAHHKKWRNLIRKNLAHAGASARATAWWRPSRGTWKIRVVYEGNWDFAGATSPSVTIRVR